MPAHAEPTPLLQANHTFVVQLHMTTQLEAGQMTGRFAHLVSRQATRCASLEALVALMARVLREVRQGGRATD